MMFDPGKYYRWESTERYYLAAVERDLLGDLVVVQRWGGRANSLGSQRKSVVASRAECVAKLIMIDKLRERHGYRLI